MNTSALSRLSLGFQHPATPGPDRVPPIYIYIYIYSYTCNKPPRLRARSCWPATRQAILDRWLSPPDGFTAGHNRFYRSVTPLCNAPLNYLLLSLTFESVDSSKISRRGVILLELRLPEDDSYTAPRRVPTLNCPRLTNFVEEASRRAFDLLRSNHPRRFYL